MAVNMKHFSVSKAQWHHIGFNTVYEMRAQQANENNYTTHEKNHVPADKSVKAKELAMADE